MATRKFLDKKKFKKYYFAKNKFVEIKNIGKELIIIEWITIKPDQRFVLLSGEILLIII